MVHGASFFGLSTAANFSDYLSSISGFQCGFVEEQNRARLICSVGDYETGIAYDPADAIRFAENVRLYFSSRVPVWC